MSEDDTLKLKEEIEFLKQDNAAKQRIIEAIGKWSSEESWEKRIDIVDLREKLRLAEKANALLKAKFESAMNVNFEVLTAEEQVRMLSLNNSWLCAIRDSLEIELEISKKEAAQKAWIACTASIKELTYRDEQPSFEDYWKSLPKTK